MATSLAKWKGEKKRGVWVTIPSGLASHIPLAVSMGFQFHHANTEAVTMAHWLPDTPNKLRESTYCTSSVRLASCDVSHAESCDV